MSLELGPCFYRRILISGLRTGGMGVISPVPQATTGVMSRIEKEILLPTFEGLKSEG